MRRLNSIEKSFCKDIVELDLFNDNFIEKLINREFPETSITIRTKEKSIRLAYPTSDPFTLLDENRKAVIMTDREIADHVKLFETVVTSVKLLELLEKEGYIHLFQNRPEKSIYDLGKELNKNRWWVEYDFLDETAKASLIRYLHMGILVTEDLKEFIQNNFISREDLLKNFELRNSKIALLISAVAVIVSALAAVYQAGDSPSKDEFNVLKDYVDSMKTQNIKSEVPTLFFRPK